jgi:hypothetical protein
VFDKQTKIKEMEKNKVNTFGVDGKNTKKSCVISQVYFNIALAVVVLFLVFMVEGFSNGR